MASTMFVTAEMLLDAMWNSVIAQTFAHLADPVLPSGLPEWVVATVVARYSELMQFPITSVVVPSLSIIRLVPSAGALSFAEPTSIAASAPEEEVPEMKSTLKATAKGNGKGEAKGKAKIPRPPNAFILYRKHHHENVKAAHPGIVNNKISGIVAGMWNAESENVKDVWKAKALAVKNEHMIKHPGYSYQPRKPEEKKRRISKGKQTTTKGKKALNNGKQTTSNDGQVEVMLAGGISLQQFGQMVDQYNSSFPLTTEPSIPATDPGTNFVRDPGFTNSTGASPATDNAEEDDFVFDDGRTREQERQMVLNAQANQWFF